MTLSDVVTGSIIKIYSGSQQDKIDERASEASSASLNLPGKNQVMDLRDDSRVDIVETLLRRKDS